eukprot:gene27006-32628_t
MDLSELSVGFLGCGKISSALCRGFASLVENRPKKIFVSRRSEDKSSALASSFPDLVIVCDSNEDIVQTCEIIFIGLLPPVARSELPKLPFSDKKLVISMMAAVGYDETKSLINIDESRLVRTVPLPSAARRSGPIVMYPPNADAEQLLYIIGTPVVCTTEAQMKPMISVTGHISSFFELMRSSEEFLTNQDIDSSTARQFVTSFYSSLAAGAFQSHESLADMRDEAATPGGLNEQSVAFLRSSPHFELHKQSLAAILDRLNKK